MLNAVSYVNQPARLAKSEESITTAEKQIATNGIAKEHDVTYYTPISWKSVSPEVLFPPCKRELM
jgi:hypothetical protein